MQTEDEFENAVKDENGELKNFIIRLEGRAWRCPCGGNVFHKPDIKKQGRYKCNSCKKVYDSE